MESEYLEALKDLEERLEGLKNEKISKFNKLNVVMSVSSKILHIADGLIKEYNAEMGGKQDPLAIIGSRIKLDEIYTKIMAVIKIIKLARKELLDLLREIARSNIEGLQMHIKIPSDSQMRANAYTYSLKLFEDRLENIEKRLALMHSSGA